MDELFDELTALVADVKAVLADHALRGRRAEPADAVLPEAAVVTVAAEEEEEIAEAVPEPAVAAALWDQLATTARSAARPAHHDDGTGAAGLARIREDLGECTRCGLCEGRRSVVFGVGDPEADLFVIGEGPGEQEDARGEPFVGPAGQMLDKMLLHVLGLAREQVYIANVVKCRPPQNRNPAPEEAATCKPFLLRQIAAVQPRLVLVLGSVALREVLGLQGIKRSRGQETRLGSIPAIPSFHPAYLLRVPDDKRLAFEDLKLARRRYDELGGRRR